MDFIRYWTDKTELPACKLVDWVSIGTSKYFDWQRRYGKVNEHNAWIPRDHWLENWEKQTVIDYYLNHPDDGYRRITYMMMDEDLVAASPSSVYRILTQADVMRRWERKPSRKGTGFEQPVEPHQHWHIDISYVKCKWYFLLPMWHSGRL